MLFYGINPVTEALRARYPLTRITIGEGKANPGIRRIEALADSANVALERHHDIGRLTGSREHQGVCAECVGDGTVSLPAGPVNVERLVMLDGIQDPHNFGAALRVCECFGFTHVIFHRGNSSGVTPAAIKASAGAFFHLTIYCSNLNSACRKLKYDGFSLYILDGAGDTDIDDLVPAERYCLVVGSEGAGVRHAIRRQADIAVSIPMSGQINSLNVSCALTTALAACRRRAAP